MKINLASFKFALVFGTALILSISMIKPAFSQEPAKKESYKKIVIKIVSDDNGKTTMIDTTMEIPDSAMVDSIKNEIEKVIATGKGGKNAHFKFHQMPQGFNYDFDIPSAPEFPMRIEELEDIDCDGMIPGGEMDDCCQGWMTPGGHQRIMRSGGHQQTLNDMLGDIPMDRVVSYSIKDRKNGKRIIIDLNDAPVFEQQDRVIIIRDAGRMKHDRNSPKRQVKVVINSDDEVKSDKSSVQPEAPSVPPPPPVQPNKKTSK